MVNRGLYLVHGISDILIEQVEQGEVTELEMIRSQAEEMFSAVGTVTKYFYFDEKLEEICEKEYINYQETVDDYKAYTGFQDYARHHNRIIDWVNIYVENQSLAENSRFRKLTEERKQEEWYKAVKQLNGISEDPAVPFRGTDPISSGSGSRPFGVQDSAPCDSAYCGEFHYPRA